MKKAETITSIISLIILAIIRTLGGKYIKNDILMIIMILSILGLFVYVLLYKGDKLLQKQYFNLVIELTLFAILLMLWDPLLNINRVFESVILISIGIITVCMFITMFKAGKLNGRL